eukprot:SM000094S24684  [mRNA]  locus=s94:113413:116557:+ [translate_table: standard]
MPGAASQRQASRRPPPGRCAALACGLPLRAGVAVAVALTCALLATGYSLATVTPGFAEHTDKLQGLLETFRAAVAQDRDGADEDGSSIELNGSRSLRDAAAARVVEVMPAALVLGSQLWADGASALPAARLDPCWNRHLRPKASRSWGYVTLTLEGGVDEHRVQIGDAAAIAYRLKATLVLPTVKEPEGQLHRHFADIYDARHFIDSLEGILRVVGRLPAHARGSKPALLTVPRNTPAEYVDSKIRPVFERSRILHLEAFSLSDTHSLSAGDELQAVRCLINYEALRFSASVEKIAERMVERMREAAAEGGGRFLAVDLRTPPPQLPGCEVANAQPNFDIQEEHVQARLRLQRRHDRDCPIAPADLTKFLHALGYPPETAIYLTVPRWHPSLDVLRHAYPNCLTKEYTVPVNEEGQLLHEQSVTDMALDFLVSSSSDIFIPATPGLFREVIVGQRMFHGSKKILQPESMSLFNESEIAPKQAASLIREIHLHNKRVLQKGVSSNATVYDHPQHFCLCSKVDKELMTDYHSKAHSIREHTQLGGHMPSTRTPVKTADHRKLAAGEKMGRSSLSDSNTEVGRRAPAESYKRRKGHVREHALTPMQVRRHSSPSHQKATNDEGRLLQSVR